MLSTLHPLSHVSFSTTLKQGAIVNSILRKRKWRSTEQKLGPLTQLASRSQSLTTGRLVSFPILLSSPCTVSQPHIQTSNEKPTPWPANDSCILGQGQYWGRWQTHGVETTHPKQTGCKTKLSVPLIHSELPGKGDLRKCLDFTVQVISITSLSSSLQVPISHMVLLHTAHSRHSTMSVYLAALGGNPTALPGVHLPQTNNSTPSQTSQRRSHPCHCFANLPHPPSPI